MNSQLKAAALSYLRAALASCAALYISGITDPKILVNALVAGFIAPILRAVDPKDSAITVSKKQNGCPGMGGRWRGGYGHPVRALWGGSVCCPVDNAGDRTHRQWEQHKTAGQQA